MDQNHKVSFQQFWECCYVGGFDEELRLKEGLVLVIVVSLI